MAIDLTELWNAINGAISSIQSALSSIFSSVSSITNLGQGIAMGLATLGSSIWDAVRKFFTDAATFVGNQLYNLGQWIYNGLVWLAQLLINALRSLWNIITSIFSDLVQRLTSYYNSFADAVNSWFTGLVLTAREKLKKTILADLTITMAWKAGERVIHPNSLRDIFFGLFGIGVSPVVSAVVAEVIDNVIPTPSTSNFPLVPRIPLLTYSPPTLEVEVPEEKPAPIREYPYYTPVIEISSIVITRYETEIGYPERELIAPISSSYEYAVVSPAEKVASIETLSEVVLLAGGGTYKAVTIRSEHETVIRGPARWIETPEIDSEYIITVTYPQLVGNVIESTYELTLMLYAEKTVAVTSTYVVEKVGPIEQVAEVTTELIITQVTPQTVTAEITAEYSIAVIGPVEKAVSISAIGELEADITYTLESGYTSRTEPIYVTVNTLYSGYSESERIYVGKQTLYSGYAKSKVST